MGAVMSMSKLREPLRAFPLLAALLSPRDWLPALAPRPLVQSPVLRRNEPLFFPILKQASADLESGDYEFLPNRAERLDREPVHGRMASYTFVTDELGSVDRSRIATIRLRSFPRKDTVLGSSIETSQHPLVCNVGRRCPDVARGPRRRACAPSTDREQHRLDGEIFPPKRQELTRTPSQTVCGVIWKGTAERLLKSSREGSLGKSPGGGPVHFAPSHAFSGSQACPAAA